MPRVKVPGFLSRSNASHRKGAKHRTALLATVTLLAGMIPAALVLNGTSAGADGSAPTIQSDFADYNPGQTVTLTGANWDPAGSPVHILVNDSIGQTWQHTSDVPPASDGTIQDVFKLSTSFIASYSVDATQQAADGSTLHASSSFTDANPSANLDQCQNGQAPSPSTDGCDTDPNDWVNGNLGASKAVYLEGDSIPYRLTFGDLSLSSHTVTIEWDTTKGGKHALDYLTTFNRSVATANPCLGVSPCSSPTTFPIPADPQVTGAGVTPAAGNFTFYGGTITSVSAYSGGAGFPTGDLSRRITLTFTATQANPVLAWGGHISTRHDWGANNSAVAISGSPYHTRLIDLDGSGGNQDRSLSADAVIFPGSITIIKDATPNGSTSFGFTGSPAPLTNFSLVDDGTSANTKLFSNITTFQTYTVNESGIPANWGFDSASCAVTSPNGGSAAEGQTTTIAMNEGENWTCTYLDSLRVGTLTVIKHVVNNNGGTATAGDWSLHVKSGASDVTGSPQAGSESGTTYTLLGGPYNVSESGGPAGYALTGITGDCDASGNVTVVPGQDKTCTLTNNDKTAHLTLVKTVTNDNGGTATATDFTLSASGPTPISGAGGANSDVDAGTYTLSETNLPGYAAGSWSCTGGTFTSPDKIKLALDQSATCTINNNDQTAHLTLVKTVTNDNGGTAATTDFTLSAAGPSPISGAGGADSDVKAGTYTLSETNLPGYTAGSWSCTGVANVGNQVTLALGQSATCTINNNDQTAHLTLIKTVTNDNGGTAVATDFVLKADGGTSVLSGAGGAEDDVNAGSYTLSETQLAGYVAGAWSCVGGTFTAPNKIALALGQSATCTINNNDQTAHLTLIKTVTNDNGGTAVATDFTLSAAGPTPLSGAGGADSDVNAGSYTLSETNLPGYTAGSWSCVGGTFTAPNKIAVGLDGSAICTINNNDKTAHLTLVKTVTNDNGGTAATTDFVLKADGSTSALNGAGGADGDVNAGSYTLSETNLPGYAAGSWSCTGGTFTAPDKIALALGQSATCTINNNDQTAHLTLVKTVTNDNGGTAVATDFTLSAAGPTPLSGAGGADANVNAGSYTLSETNLPGYTAGAWSCTGGTFTAPNKIAVALNGSATCTINNNDQAAHLTLVKTVTNDNGGTAMPSSFTLSAAGPTPISGAGGADANVNAGSYSLSETNLPGYAAGSWSCTGGAFTSPDKIALALGQSATCTINNNDIAPALHLRKVVVNNNGGTKTVADFTLTANGAGTNDLSGISPVDSGTGLKADTWALSETNVYGYSASAWVCVGGGSQSGSNISLAVGQSATCTITNDDLPGTIVIQKITKPANTGSFGFTTTGTGYNGFTLPGGGQNSQTLNAGTYTVKEGTQLGWILTGIGQDPADPNAPYSCAVTGSGGSTGVGDLNTQTASISLKNGDTVTCVFENTGQGVTRTQGFWATHTPLANIAWFGGTAFGHTFPGVAGTVGIGDTLLCGRNIDTLGKLMGGFWSDVSKTSTGVKRSALDQARMQLLQQLLSAELNASAFGSVPSSGTFAAWESAYCGTNTNTIKNAQQQAASFNTQGDSSTFTPGTSADSKNARAIATLSFWDVLP
jgi:hypothetical protein